MPFALISEALALFICAAALAVLARRGRGDGLMPFTVVASLALTTALLVTAGSVVDLRAVPRDILARLVVIDLLGATLPVVAMALVALRIARGASRPRLVVHVIATAVAGLVTWLLVMLLTSQMIPDLVQAVAQAPSFRAAG